MSTFVKETRKCKYCGRKYDWNPDVGRMYCPYCSNEKREFLNLMKEDKEMKEG